MKTSNLSSLLLILCLYRLDVFAFERISLLSKSESLKNSAEKDKKTEEKGVQEQRRAKPQVRTTALGNLPLEYLLRQRKPQLSENPVILPQQKSHPVFSELRPGDIVEATILESIFAYADSKAPIRALIKNGPLKDSIFIGESSLEKNSKRIVIHFTKFRKHKKDEIYELSASALDTEGVLGVKGKVFSNEALFFSGELLAAGAAGFNDATMDRSQNLLGNFIEAPSLGNATKRALSSALSKSSERFSEKLKTVPEYALLKGPVDIKIIITNELKI